MAETTNQSQLFGRVVATVEGLTKRYDEDRAEGRDRGKKIDEMLERMAIFSGTLQDGLRSVENKLREQSRDAADQEDRTKRAIADIRLQVSSGLDLVNLHIKGLDEQLVVNTKRVGEVAGQTANLQSEQTKIREELAEVKSDTAKLQQPVAQLIGLRNAAIAWGAAVASILTVVWLFLTSVWDKFGSYITSYFSHH